MSVFDKKKREAIVKFADNNVDSPWWLEPWDGIAVGWGFDYVDEKFGDKVPEKFHDDLNSVADAVLAEKWEDIVNISTPEFLDSIITSIPGVSDDTKAMMILYNVKAIFEYVKYLATKKLKALKEAEEK